MPRTLPFIAMQLLAAPLPAPAQPPNQTEITALFFLPDGKSGVAACLDGKLHVYDAGTGKERFTVDAHADGCWTAAHSPDGKIVAPGGGDKLVRLWDTATWKPIRSFEGHTKEVLAVAFAPDGQTLASGGADRSIRVWDIATAEQKRIWHGHELKALGLAFSPDAKLLAPGGTATATIPGLVQGSVQSDHVRLWDRATGKEVRQHPFRGSTVAFSPDGRAFVASGHYATGKQREGGGVALQGGTLVSVGRADKDTAWFALQGAGSAVSFSADGRRVALAYGNRRHPGPF